MLALVAACGSSDDSAAGDDLAEGGGVVTIATVTPEAENTATGSASPVGSTATPVAPGAPTQSPAGDPGATLTGFIYPIAGACLPEGEQLMPNAPRTYRSGIHEGVDFYGVDNCTAIGSGTPVLAVKAGRVIRVDHDYLDLTAQALAALRVNPTSDASLDAFRGRQVWIDHGNGVVTRYCHLDGVIPELRVNDMVAQGTTIGYVGESGTPGSVESRGTEFHLHWEVRVGDSYLGAGLDAAEVRALYLELFGP